LEDDAYWQRLSDGLALFASKGFWRAYRLSTDVAEAVHVSDRFAVRPVVPAAVGDGEFLVLAGSQNKVRLLEGTASTIRELDLGSIPSSIDDMAGDTQPPSHQQQRFSGAAGAGPAARAGGRGRRRPGCPRLHEVSGARRCVAPVREPRHASLANNRSSCQGGNRGRS